VNNLPGVATQQCTGRESNLRSLDHKSNFAKLKTHFLLLRTRDEHIHLRAAVLTFSRHYWRDTNLFYVTLHYITIAA